MKLPAGHTVVLSIAVDGQEGRIIGTSRTTADVPDLLRAVASLWERYRREGKSVPPMDPDGYDGKDGWRFDFS